MKTTFLNLLFACLVIVWGCGQKDHDHHEHHEADTTAASGNEALLNEVDKLHMEAMGKMEDIFKKKEELKKELETAAADKKKEIENTIAKLDSADHDMMDWMHKFKPLPDSVGAEKAREYLENEMEKVKKLKEEIEEALGSK